MKRIGNRYSAICGFIRIPLACCLLLICVAGCRSVSGHGENPANGYTSVSLRNFNMTGDDETIIKSIRLVMAKSGGGEVVYNQLLTWNGGNTVPPEDAQSNQPSDPIELTSGAGDYDFYLFANEESMGPENVKILRGAIGNAINLKQLKPVAFAQREITAIDVVNKPLVSLGILKKHTLQGNGTKDNPEIVSATLVRNIAKFSLEVRRKKTSEDPAIKPGIKITGFELLNIPNSYQVLFSNEPFLKNNAESNLWNLSREGVTISDEDYNTTSATQAIYNSPDYYLSEHLFERGGSVNKPTSLKVYYTTAASNYTTEVSSVFQLDAQSLIEIREGVLKYIDAQYADFNDISRYSVIRSLHYKVILNITDQKAEPALDVVVQPWIQNVQDVEITDQIFNATKDEVMLNYYGGAENNVMILNNFLSGNLKWSVSGEGDPSEWLEVVSPSGGDLEHLDGTPLTFTFRAKSFNDTSYDAQGKPHDAERQATVTFTSDKYVNPVKVTVKQRARQLIRPERRYVNFIYSGGTVTIPVESFGREWGVSIVSDVSTVTTPVRWVTATRSGNSVVIKVESTNGIDLLRHAELKIYDGTGEAAYIRVEQGNYIPVTITESGLNYTILDRNLGARKSAYNRNAWKDGSEITNRERVARCGYFYQQGRIPDGYHTLGMDPLDGVIRQSLEDQNTSLTKVSFANRPNGPLKWGDTGSGYVYGKYTRDPQYGRFIKAKETPVNATSADESNSWFVTEGGATPYPSWITPDKNKNKNKNKGVDPCPEGYRVPTIDELHNIILHTNDAVYSNVWVSAGIWLKGTYEGSMKTLDIYLPIVPKRNEEGFLNIDDWLYDDYAIYGYYASSTATPSAWSVGTIDVTTSHNIISKDYKVGHAAGVVVRCIKDSE